MDITSSLTKNNIENTHRFLHAANARFNDIYPGESLSRQPVHTVYGGAHIFKEDTAEKMGVSALNHLNTYAPNFVEFAKILELNGYDELPNTQEDISSLNDFFTSKPSEIKMKHVGYFAYIVYQRVVEKLSKEAVEDFRIDFEDGYGIRPDEEEDNHSMLTAEEVAKGMTSNSLPPFIGIRIKPLSEEQKNRSIRTLDIFVSTLSKKTNGILPDQFVVTIPKVTIPEHITAIVQLFEKLEERTKLTEGSLKLEFMIETPQSILDSNGNSSLLSFVRASKGRCVGAHFGVYDYTASTNITAENQSLIHPNCDFARHIMQVALAGTGIRLSDGATNVLPMESHRIGDRIPLTKRQIEENKAVVQNAWRLNFNHVNHSLKHGYYQGWDLHPNQLPLRYAAMYSFFLDGLSSASLRLKSFMDKATQATLMGDIFDDAATGQALLNYFLQGISCGAILEEDAEKTGLTLDEIRTRSFKKILEGRKS
jgi:citrate lyase beta subunit